MPSRHTLSGLFTLCAAALVIAGWQAGCTSPSFTSKPANPPANHASDASPANPGLGGPAAADRRVFRPRGEQSIFSPLDLPTPNRIRTASGTPGPDYWQQQADYVIDATLDEAAEAISAKATITYTNNSPEELPFIWIHLEQNLFKDDSLATLSSLPDARFSRKSGFKGGFTIQSVKLSTGQTLPIHIYDTIARIDLPTPLAAASGAMPMTKLGEPPLAGNTTGSQVTFEIAWTFNIPQYGIDRMGIQHNEQGDVFQIAQWFPAVCVFDDVHGWNTLPYLGQGEFYTNFGVFDVRLTVPRSHIVAATGSLMNAAEVLTPAQADRLSRARKSADTVIIRTKDEVADPASRPAGAGPLTWRFRAENVRTFAWTSSASFIWDAATVNGQVGTLAQSVYPKEALPLWSRSTEMLRSAIEGYNKKWFEYPYPVATNVNGGVGGMEYPMIIFCGDRDNEHNLFGVTTHEIGHNWFPMVVNTDERRFAWMDEGFDSFMNIYSHMEYFNKDKPDEDAQGLVGALRHQSPPMNTPADQLGPGMLGTLMYAKPAIALYLLREEVLGAERFDAAFREYIRRWAFKSPQPADFYRTMENVAGADLAWFWRGWITETTQLDQTVDAVEQRPDKETVTITFGNLGEMVMPLTFKATFDDGTTLTRKLPVEIWAWTSHWPAEITTSGKRVVEVQVDPAQMMPDANPANNIWKSR
ncbi:MAG: M1 family metallopeptidase [Pyrinomonadaceae bacterium]|nr:M1 family metallopeptidase [Phycisphaerales bacterium]